MAVRNEKCRSISVAVLFGTITAAGLFLDLTTKWVVFLYLAYDKSLSIIPGLLSFHRSNNFGAVFGIGQGMGWLFGILTVIIAAVILGVVWVHGRSSRLLTAALGLVFAGALGNLWDRIVHGCVRDFIDVYIGQYHWPTFNVADMGICVGAGMLILYSFRVKPKEVVSTSDAQHVSASSGAAQKRRRAK